MFKSLALCLTLLVAAPAIADNAYDQDGEAEILYDVIRTPLSPLYDFKVEVNICIDSDSDLADIIQFLWELPEDGVEFHHGEYNNDTFDTGYGSLPNHSSVPHIDGDGLLHAVVGVSDPIGGSASDGLYINVVTLFFFDTGCPEAPALDCPVKLTCRDFPSGSPNCNSTCTFAENRHCDYSGVSTDVTSFPSDYAPIRMAANFELTEGEYGNGGLYDNCPGTSPRPSTILDDVGEMFMCAVVYRPGPYVDVGVWVNSETDGDRNTGYQWYFTLGENAVYEGGEYDTEVFYMTIGGNPYIHESGRLLGAAIRHNNMPVPDALHHVADLDFKKICSETPGNNECDIWLWCPNGDCGARNIMTDGLLNDIPMDDDGLYVDLSTSGSYYSDDDYCQLSLTAIQDFILRVTIKAYFRILRDFGLLN